MLHSLLVAMDRQAFWDSEAWLQRVETHRMRLEDTREIERLRRELLEEWAEEARQEEERLQKEREDQAAANGGGKGGSQ